MLQQPVYYHYCNLELINPHATRYRLEQQPPTERGREGKLARR